MSFITDIISWVKLQIWPLHTLKRRRDSVAEEEDDDFILNFQTSSKRPRQMTNTHPFTFNTKSDGANSLNSSGRSQLVRKIPIRIEKKTSHRKVSQEMKENDPDCVEVIELDNETEPKPIERRPALTNLAIRTSSHQPSHKSVSEKKLEISVAVPNSDKKLDINVTIPEKKQNGVHSSLFNSFSSSHLKPSRTSTPKQTALTETYKHFDRLKYSKLLAEFHNTTGNSSSLRDNEKFNTISSLSGLSSSPASGTYRPPGRSADIVEVVDLTRDDRKDYFKKRTHIPVKPYQAPPKDDDNVKFLEERKLPYVNSLERKLSQNSHVSPEWILEIKRKYGEKERERRKQVEEETLKKELYAKHNEAKRLATLEGRLSRHLKITDVVLDESEEGEAALPELTPEMEERVSAALKLNPAGQGLVEGFGQKITRRDIQTLNGLNWLNDEVINFYMNLIIERGKEDKKLSVYAFNTFFYPKLVTQGYSTLKRWTKKVDIFNHEFLLVPIHLGMHWCMSTIDFRDHTIRYYDSMGGENNKCLNALLRYLNDESMDKKKTPYDTTGWKLVNMKDIPQQMNGSDCGMFSCMFAEYASRNARITFSQKEMPYFRRKMVYEILTKKLLL